MRPAAWLLILGLVTATDRQLAPGSPAAVLTAEELQIVVAALEQTGLREARPFVLGKRRKSAVAVVPDSTLASCIEPDQTFCIREPVYATVMRALGASGRGLADAFRSRTSSSSAVAWIGERVTVAPVAELSGMFRQGDGWQAFQRQYGTARLLRFSAPAIAGDRAAVYVAFGCGNLCGKSWLVTLERRAGVFRVRKSQLLAMN